MLEAFFYQAFFQKVLDENPPYSYLTLLSETFCLAGGVGAGSGAGAGAGAGADLEEVYADTGALRSVLTGLSKSSRRPPLKRSKSSSGDGLVWTTAAAAEGHSPGWLAAWAACWYVEVDGTAL